MGKLLKNLLREASTLIPFSCVIPRICNNWAGEVDQSKSLADYNFIQKANLLRRMVFNAGLSVIGPIYVIGALFYGANPLNPQDYRQKVKDSAEQRKVQEQQQIREYSEKQFHKADKNNDLVLDSNEFYDYIYERRNI